MFLNQALNPKLSCSNLSLWTIIFYKDWAELSLFCLVVHGRSFRTVASKQVQDEVLIVGRGGSLCHRQQRWRRALVEDRLVLPGLPTLLHGQWWRRGGRSQRWTNIRAFKICLQIQRIHKVMTLLNVFVTLQHKRLLLTNTFTIKTWTYLTENVCFDGLILPRGDFQSRASLFQQIMNTA